MKKKGKRTIVSNVDEVKKWSKNLPLPIAMVGDWPDKGQLKTRTNFQGIMLSLSTKWDRGKKTTTKEVQEQVTCFKTGLMFMC